MSYRGYNSGCGNKLVFIIIIITIIMLIVEGIKNCDNTSHYTKSTNYNTTNTTKTKKDFEIGQQVDPVLRTSTGEIVKVANAPDYYYDIRTTCKICKGSGKEYNWNGTKFIEGRCSVCCGWGFGKRPISEMPKGTVPYEKID